MKQSIVTPTGVPTANLAINKSRIKIYNKDGQMPTYYIEKGQEFQIELFNPTTDTVLAKIELNGTAIAQGGLVLRPGERVFLERYIDVAKKFKFDTYEVSNTEEVKKAIADNGDLKVQFFRESKPAYTPLIVTLNDYHYRDNWQNQRNNYYSGTPNDFLRGATTAGRGHGTLTTQGMSITTTASGTYDASATSANLCNASYTSGVNLDSLSFGDVEKTIDRPMRRLKKSKSIETGRVEMGAESNQKLQYVDKKFDFYAFCTVEYKLLPVSQKVNTAEDLQVKRYCTNCGAKHKQNFKYCPTCGTKA